MTPLFFVVVGLYGAAAVVFITYLFGRSEATLSVARWVAVAAAAAHLAMIGLLCTRQFNPLRDLRGALSLSAMILVVGFLLSTWRSRMGAAGALIVPLAMALLFSSWLVTPSVQLSRVTGTLVTLGRIHIALVAIGVGIFGLASAVSILYILQEASIKKKRIGPLFRRVPPLTTMDRFGRRLILSGFGFFTLAMVTGLIWFSQLPGHPVHLEYIISGVTWLLFALLIIARVTAGWRGKRAAWMTVIGFIAMVLILVGYMWRRMVGG